MSAEPLSAESEAVKPLSTEPLFGEPRAAAPQGGTTSPAPPAWVLFLQRALRATACAGRAVADRAAATASLIDVDARAHVTQLPLAALTLWRDNGDVRPTFTAADREAGRLPVVAVHGLGGRPGNFVLYRAWRAMHGHGGMHAVDLSRDASIDAKVARLADFVEAVCLIEGVEQVDVVAHSLGGLLTRAALRGGAVAARVRRVVTLGTPHAGTYAARFAGQELGLALRPGSSFIDGLGAPPVPFATLTGAADVLVVPLENAALPGVPHAVLPGLTHYAILSSPRAFEAIDAALRGAPVATPSASSAAQPSDARAPDVGLLFAAAST